MQPQKIREFPRRDLLHGPDDERLLILARLFPKEALETFAKFIAERETGNLALNVKEGQVMGWKVETFHRVKY